MSSLLNRFRPAEFAPTCILAEERAAPTRAGFRLRPCDCGCATLVRIRRSAWMRVVPMLLLYQCRRCSARFLHSRIDQKNHYGYVYRPSVTVRQASQARRK